MCIRYNVDDHILVYGSNTVTCVVASFLLKRTHFELIGLMNYLIVTFNFQILIVAVTGMLPIILFPTLDIMVRILYSIALKKSTKERNPELHLFVKYNL